MSFELTCSMRGTLNTDTQMRMFDQRRNVYILCLRQYSYGCCDSIRPENDMKKIHARVRKGTE